MNDTGCLYDPVYRLIFTGRTTEDGIAYTAYGISCSRKDAFGGGALCAIEDISSDPELVESMVTLFNMARLRADCFRQAVEALIS